MRSLTKRELKLKTSFKVLGRGKNKIAESLRRKRIKGFRESPCHCPVANYIRKQFHGAEIVEVDMDFTSIGFFDGEFIDVNTPEAICAFMDAFDNGSYDYLCRKA